MAAGTCKEINQTSGAIPRQYDKLVLYHKEKELRAIDFILPNESSSLSLSMFSVPVDQVEQVTNLDFFYLLPDDIEEGLESAGNIVAWE